MNTIPLLRNLAAAAAAALALILPCPSFGQDGPVAWWCFDEAAGTTAADSSGNGHDATLISGASFDPAGGMFGGAASLDGMNDEIRAPDHPDYEFAQGQDFSITLFYNSGGVASETNNGLITKGYRVYIDRTIVSTTTLNASSGGDWNMGVNNHDLVIGDHFNRFTTGKFDEVAIWRRVLSDAEIVNIAVEGVGDPPPPLMLGQVVINEFMASNEDAMNDGDGNSSDWIEIWNSTDAPVNLGGWVLTDDVADLAKWPFPAITLQPDEYLLVFASGQLTDTYVDFGGFLHTNFELDKAAGGYLALVDGAAQVVDEYVSYPRQREDISYGLFGSEDPLSAGYLAAPTPLARNSSEGFSGFVDDTTFSVDRGIYAASFTTTLASATPGATLIYTIDGSEPSATNGTQVAAPDAATPPSVGILISTTTTLRAIATKLDHRPTDIDTQSYLFPADVLLQSNASVPTHVNWGHAGADYAMDPDIVNHANPEVRPVTDDFKRAPTISLVMDWDEMFGSGGIYINGESVERSTSIELINPDADVAAPNAEAGFQVDGTVQIVGGSITNYNAMLNLSRQNMGVQANYQAVADVLHIDEFIAYMIANYYVGNTDWAHQNWYASYNKVDPEGRWRYHNWDPELCLKSTNENVTGKDNSGGPTEVFRNLINNPEFELQFADAVHRHFHNDGPLTPANAAASYMRRADEVEFLTRLESARWGDNRRSTPFTRLDWLLTRDQLLGTATGSALDNYFPLRTEIVLNQFIARSWYPNTDPPVFTQYGGLVATGFPLEITSPDGGTIYYTLDGSDPRQPLTGNVAGTAYTGEVPLTATGAVKARVRSGGSEWSALTEATFVVGTPASAATLVVSEIMYHPVGGTSHEYIEVQNISATETIDLTGVKFTAGITFEFPVGTTLAPGARIMVVEDSSAFDLEYGAGHPVAGQYTGKLDNGGEQLVLEDLDGAVIRDFSYGDDSPWPESPDGLGPSLVLIAPGSVEGYDSNPFNWRPSVADGGTPGGSDGVSFSGVPDDDLDSDDIPALMEHALASSDNVSDHSILPTVGTGGHITFTYRRNLAADDLIYAVQISNDVSAWSSDPANVVFVSSVDSGNGFAMVTYRSATPISSVPRQFMRLEVSKR